ncbi:MarR family transcriptional regulator [Roseibacterium sp. SDUM158016]|jgi:DNA-binding MarR family transcriptional regulator|uniref:MarR family winged helix-turn-helix transcriptional regulator n=1 Tax=Roseicyclus sediminis TaxID=2980997 RepID=UPI0021CE773E|nr:MarR family transcriptional regulator [Roseibacterium sp. SDUM158016]MCU4654030.1 MarR family transcriptional regulator [Roseibacterium sp. SDUM158016]
MDGTAPKFGLHASIGHHITRSARIVERRVEGGLRHHGLTRVGWCILLAVEEEGLKNPSEIAHYIGIDRTATSRALRQLENDGLIGREMGREDRRTTEVSLTDEGRARLRAAMPLCVENMAHFNAKLSAAESLELKRLLTLLTAGEDD